MLREGLRKEKVRFGIGQRGGEMIFELRDKCRREVPNVHLKTSSGRRNPPRIVRGAQSGGGVGEGMFEWADKRPRMMSRKEAIDEPLAIGIGAAEFRPPIRTAEG